MDSEKEQLERKHQLERDVADAILALASGKGYLVVEGSRTRQNGCGPTIGSLPRRSARGRPSRRNS